MSDKMEALMKRVQKDHGPGAMVRGSESRLDIPRISTGIFVVDYATAGGVPIGRTSMFYGKPGSGKSNLAAKTVASSQEMCRRCYGPVVFEDREVPVMRLEPQPDGTVVEVPGQESRPVAVDCVNECRAAPWEGDEDDTKDKKDKKDKKKGAKKDGKKKKEVWPGRMTCLWIDAEATFNADFYRQFGMDVDAIWLSRPDYGEQAVDIGDSAIRTGECDLIVVDSVANLVPKKEREDSAEDHQMAVQARLVNKMLRTWTGSLNEIKSRDAGYDCTILLINQIRMKVGIFPSYTRPGGMGQEFATSLDLNLTQGNFQFDKSGRPLWMTTKFAVDKCKVGPARMAGDYRMCVKDHPEREPGDTWDDEVVFDAAKSNGLVAIDKKSGKVKVLDQEFDDEDAAREILHRRTGFFRTLRARTLDLMVGRPSDGKLSDSKTKKRGEMKV